MEKVELLGATLTVYSISECKSDYTYDGEDCQRLETILA